MLTKEQEKTLISACELFKDARHSEDKVASLSLYNEAFGMLIEHIDDTDDLNYRLVFANCIEMLQRKGNMDFSQVIIQAKVNIYINALQEFLKTQQYNASFQGHIAIAFDALARLFLLGEDNVIQSDEKAYICYLCIKSIGLPALADLYLVDFIKDETTGEWKFIGVRPK